MNVRLSNACCSKINKFICSYRYHQQITKALIQYTCKYGTVLTHLHSILIKDNAVYTLKKYVECGQVPSTLESLLYSLDGFVVMYKDGLFLLLCICKMYKFSLIIYQLLSLICLKILITVSL